MNVLFFALDHPVVSSVVALGVIGGIGKFLLPLITTCQELVDSFLRMCARLVVVSKSVSDASTQGIVYHYLNHVTRGYGNMDDKYEIMFDHIKPADRRQAYFVRFTWHTWRLWFLGRVPMLMVPHGVEDQPSFMFVRGTVNWDELVVKACAWQADKEEELFNKDSQRRFKIIHVRGDRNTEPRLNKKDERAAPSQPSVAAAMLNHYEVVGWKHEDIGIDRPANPTDVLAMNDNMVECEDQVKFWKKNQDWYKEREIPWKMGVLLYGPPGTGKTSLVRAIGLKLDMPIYAFELSTMDSRDFVDAWGNMRAEASKIVLLEDIDTVFHLRENIIPGHKLSFDVLLNTLDGIDEDDGTLVFVTTNRIEYVDEALGRPTETGESSRPGRIDITFEIGQLDHAGRLKLARRILRDDVLALKMAIDHPNDTPVIFRERCRKLAIDILWGKQ